MSGNASASTDESTAQALLVALIRAGAAPDASHPPPPPAIDADDWQTVLARARQHGLSGLLYRSLEMQARADVPPDVRQALRETYLRTNVAQLLAYGELAALMDIFRAAQIPFIVLKGAALSRTLYSDPALRPFGDLDLLVHEHDHARATELVLAREYQAVVEMSAGSDSALWGQQTFVRTGNQPARVELHWHLFVTPYYRQRARLAWFWDECETFDVSGHSAQTFNVSAQLLHLAAHSSLHHSETRFIWLYDLALLLARHGDTLAWDKISASARVFGLMRALQTALQQTATVWQVPLPSQAQAIFTAAPAEPYERIVFALTRSRHKPARWLSDGLYYGGAHYFLAHLFPSPAYMRTHYRVRHTVLLPFYYGGRLGIGAYKFARALLALPFGS